MEADWECMHVADALAAPQQHGSSASCLPAGSTGGAQVARSAVQLATCCTTRRDGAQLHLPGCSARVLQTG